MSLFTQWDEISKKERSPQESKTFWEEYFLKEKEIYALILGNKDFLIETTVKEFATKYQLEPVFVVGFIDGINTSLQRPVEIETLEEDTPIKFDIDVEKLLFNMHDAGADWLYQLEEWEDVLPLQRRKEIEKEFKDSKTFVKEIKAGRNDPCPCGSGLKFKKCCGK